MWKITKKTTLDDLRHKDSKRNNGFLSYAEKGEFNKVLLVALADKNDIFSAQDLLERNENGVHAIMALGWRQELDQAFDHKLWAGDVESVKKLWQQVPDVFKKQIDFQTVLKQVTGTSLKKQRASGVKRRPSSPKS